MRPSTWSPEISRRRSGWCSTTWEGACPGVSYTVHGAHVGVHGDALDELAVGRERPAMPLGARAARGGPALQRRLGHAALARDLDRPAQRRLRVLATARWRARGADAATARSPCAPAAWRPGRRGRRGRACRRAAGRRRGRARPDPARARARAGSPARACRSPPARGRRPRPAPRRCSAARRGSAAAAAAATPRARPARPVPTSLRRVGLRTARDGTVAAMDAAARARSRATAAADGQARPPPGSRGAGRRPSRPTPARPATCSSCAAR